MNGMLLIDSRAASSTCRCSCFRSSFTFASLSISSEFSKTHSTLLFLSFFKKEINTRSETGQNRAAKRKIKTNRFGAKERVVDKRRNFEMSFRKRQNRARRYCRFLMYAAKRDAVDTVRASYKQQAGLAQLFDEDDALASMTTS